MYSASIAMYNLINPKVEVLPVDWINTFVQHEQDSDSRFYDESALDRVVEMEYPKINGVADFETKLVISRTRVLSLSECITSRSESETYALFCKSH